jgi:hypothetical protein
MYTQYFDILSEVEYSTCKEIIDNSLWQYGHLSNPNSSYKFWMIPKLYENYFFNTTFIKKIENITNNKFQIHRIYANGHSFGQEGDWHRDSKLEDDWTFLYYFNEGDPTIIGETYFKDKDDNITDIAKPIYNSGILFKSDITHKGSSPKITFTDLRITIAFKLKLIKFKSDKTLF